jgi:hypothetical protein
MLFPGIFSAVGVARSAAGLLFSWPYFSSFPDLDAGCKKIEWPMGLALQLGWDIII